MTMRCVGLTAVAALLSLGPVTTMLGQPKTQVLAVTDVTVGQNLEGSVMVTLNGPLTADGVDVTLTSNDPGRLVLSATPESAGSPSITIKLRPTSREMEVYAQALDKSGTATFTASASGVPSVTGTVTLAPSGIVIGGPYGAGKALFLTTTGAGKTQINVYSALLDSSLNYVARQRLAGGRSVNVNIVNSDPAVGKVDRSTVNIAGGLNSATVLFQPASEGESKLTVDAPSGFSAPAQALFKTVTAKVTMPGLVVTDDIMIGQNLQDGGVVGLNQPAPAGGLTVTLTCQSPGQLLFTSDPSKKGTNSLAIKIPAGASQGFYYIQAVGGSGKVTLTASAPGYRDSRPGLVTLAPSGVVVAGPLSFTRAGSSPGFAASLATHQPVVITVYTVFLDPVTHRSADVTVQPLRAGLSMTVALRSSDPSIGTVGSPIIINGPANQASTTFVPIKAGTTILSVVTPEGYTPSSNATTLKSIVTE